MPSGPVRGLVSNPSQFSFSTLRIGLDNWHRQNIRVEGDYQDQRNLDLGAGGFNLADRGWDRDLTTVRLRGFWTKTFGKGGSQVLPDPIPAANRNGLAEEPGPSCRRLERLQFRWCAVAGYPHRQSGGGVRCGHAAHRETAGLAEWPAALARRLRQHDCEQRRGHVHVLVAYRVRRRPARDVYGAPRCRRLLLRGVTAWRLDGDDISVSKTVNLAIGLRQELESDTSQRVHLAPRGQLDWSPSRVPHTTFRVGAGIFYAWLNPTDIEQTVRVDGVHQQDLLVINPGFPDPTVGADATALPSGRYLRASTLTLPRLIRSSIGVDQTRGRLLLHVDYTHQTGSQLYRGQNLNAPDATGVRPDPQFGNVIEVQSTGHSRLDAVNLSATYSDPKHSRGVRMNYTFARAYDDTDGAFFVPVRSGTGRVGMGSGGPGRAPPARRNGERDGVRPPQSRSPTGSTIRRCPTRLRLASTATATASSTTGHPAPPATARAVLPISIREYFSAGNGHAFPGHRLRRRRAGSPFS